MRFEGKQINIPVKGILRGGTDFLAPDGAMNEVIGMEYKDGSWLPYVPKTTAATDDVDPTASGTATAINLKGTYIHKHSDNTTKELYLTTDGVLFYNTTEMVQLTTGVKDLTFVGNTVCVSTTRGLEFFIWNENTYMPYTWQNNAKVDLRVTAGCAKETDGDPIVGMSYATKISGQFVDDDAVIDLKDETNKESVVGGIYAAQGALRDIGGLTGYFLACYAYRLKTGDIVQASHPVLLGRPNLSHGNHTVGFKESTPADSEQFDVAMLTPTNVKLLKGKSPSTGEVDRYAIFTPPSYYEMDEEDRPNLNKMYKLGEQYVRYKAATTGEDATPAKCYTVNESLYAAWIDSNYMALVPREGWWAPLAYVPNLMCTRMHMQARNGIDPNNPNIRNEYIYVSYAASNKLQYRIPELNVVNNDLVESVCIFLSPQISPFKNVEDVRDFDDNFYSIGRTEVRLRGLSETYFHSPLEAASYIPKYRESKEIIDDIKDIKSLYLVKEIPFSELEEGNEWIDIDLTDKLGDNLVVREQLPLTAFDYSKIIAEHIDAYNYRTHVYDFVQHLFDGFKLTDMSHFGGERQIASTELQGTGLTYRWEIAVEMKDETGASKVVTYQPTDLDSLIISLSPFLCYPSKNATKMTIKAYQYADLVTARAVYSKVLQLVNNDALNMSFYVDDEMEPVQLELEEIEIQ